MKKATYIEMDHHELEKIIAKAYGLKIFQFIADNDSSYRYDLEKGEKLDEWDEKLFNKILKQKSCDQRDGEDQVVMTKLCMGGHLEPGEYLINVSW